MDDWELSSEELDSLERDALRQLAERNQSCSAATTSNGSNSRPTVSPPSPIVPSSRSPAKPTFLLRSPLSSDKINTTQRALPSSPVPKIIDNPKPQQARILPSSVVPNKIDNPPPKPQQARILPSSMVPNKIDNPSPKPQHEKVVVKFFLHATGNIAAKFPYDKAIVGAFHNIPRASWNAKERLWMFPLSSLPTAESVLRDIPGSNIEIENLDPLVRRAIAAATALPDLRGKYIQIPSYIESKLLPFQRDGVRFILQHGGRALLADEMGLGKTLQAIAVASCVREAWPVLILTPSSLRLHWASMIQQWLNIASSDILVILSQWNGSNRGGFNIVPSNSKRPIYLDGVFNIISYDIVPKLQDRLLASNFKVVIADESHFLKNAQAKRTSASLPILQKAQYTILLSGTPALSRPIELFKQLEALYPDVYKNVHEYGNRYCKGGIFGVYQGASNHEELHNLIKATLMIRRLKKDVLSELPVKRRQQVFLELGEKQMKPINALFRELEIVKTKIKSCQSKEEAESMKFTEKGLINKIYTDSAEAKIPAVLDYLGTIIEEGCKFLIFAHHQSMIEAIHAFLQKKKVECIRIDGSTPAASRQALVTDFQEKESVRAAVLSIKAGGVGLTLTAASTVIFAELSWTPGDIVQAEDRAHRIGQVSSVNIYYLLANDTVDDIIWDVIQNKLDNLGQHCAINRCGERFSSMAITRSMEQRMETVENDFKDMTAAIRSLDGRHEESVQSQRAMFSEMEEFMARFSGEPSPPPPATASEMGDTTSPDEATLSATVQTLPLQKMELPTFDGSDARAWLARAEQYFLVHKTPTAHRLQTVMMAMAGPAMSWFQFLQTRRPHIDWVAFREELLVRFGDDATDNAYEPLASMQQTGTLADYITTFECHIAPMKGLTEELHCGFFLSGLRPDLRAQIPDDALHDYTAALKAARRAERTGSLPVSTNRGPPSPSPPTSAQCLTSPGVSQPPSTPTPSTLATASSSQVSVSPRPFKQMSETEYQRHRAAGTCFRCGQRYSPTHRCPPRTLNVLIGDDDEEDPLEFIDAALPATTEPPDKP